MSDDAIKRDAIEACAAIVDAAIATERDDAKRYRGGISKEDEALIYKLEWIAGRMRGLKL